ncbi:MAG: cytochrome o ubiquinol oxidase subunit IV [Paenacidovorax caeni]
MSASHTHTHAAHGQGAHHHDDHHHQDAGPHSTLSGYMVGFVLSVILTAIPFWLVMGKVIADKGTMALVLGVFAVAQILVHMVCFLHMNGKIEGGWTLLSTLFTVVFVAVGIAGTLWVMFHMNANMMPTHAPGHMPAVEQRAP